jgi:hypothetical protein
MSEWIDTKDQAALIRAALKKAFPGTTFRVRLQRYAGGSTVYVRWTDGPTYRAVTAIANSFDGRRFDGMTDHAYAAEHYLTPEGESIFAREVGGYDNHVSDEPMPQGAKAVRYSGSVSCDRELSTDFEAELLGELAQAAEVEVETLTRNGYVRGDVKLPLAIGREHDEELAGQILRMSNAEEYTDRLLHQLAGSRARVAQ